MGGKPIQRMEDCEEGPAMSVPLPQHPRTLDDQIKQALRGEPPEIKPRERLSGKRLLRRVDAGRGGLITGAAVVLHLLAAPQWCSANDLARVLAIQPNRARKVLKTLREEGMIIGAVVDRRGRPPTVLYTIPRAWFAAFGGPVDGRIDPRSGGEV